MLTEGDQAPEFTAPLANGDIGEFTLSERLDEAPLVLAFFPAAFTSVCTHEMAEFRDRMDAFESVGATVYGVSVDSPFVLNEFREVLDLDFALISDPSGEVVDTYGISTDFDDIGLHGIAKRAVFVVDGAGKVTYSEVTDNPGVEPDYDAIESAVGAT